MNLAILRAVPARRQVPKREPPLAPTACQTTSMSGFELEFARTRQCSARGYPFRSGGTRANIGGSVWEGLLQNPQLTAPEVAQIPKTARRPTALVGVIVANAAWLSSGEVRRALLGNPRVAGPHFDRVLPLCQRSSSASGTMSAYRGQVRAAAKRLLGD